MSKLLMWPKRPNGAARVAAMQASAVDDGMDGIYRQYTLLLLRRYCRLSVDMGRLPSILGREFFRAKVTSYKMHTFEDAVVFVHDMERCIDRLSADEKRLVAGLVFMEYSQSEFARLLGISRGTVVRRYNEMLDGLTQKLRDSGLIAEADLRRRRRGNATVAVMPVRQMKENGCSEVKADDTSARKPCASEICQEKGVSAVAVGLGNERN